MNYKWFIIEMHHKSFTIEMNNKLFIKSIKTLIHSLKSIETKAVFTKTEMINE